MKRLRQILAAFFAVSMLTAYVVHAHWTQRQRSRDIAPTVRAPTERTVLAQSDDEKAATATSANLVGSKPEKAGPSASTAGDQFARQLSSSDVASSSKSIVPAISVPQASPQVPTLTAPREFFPGSKSAPVFTPNEPKIGARVANPLSNIGGPPRNAWEMVTSSNRLPAQKRPLPQRSKSR